MSIRSLLRKFVIKGLMIASSCVWIGSAYALSIEPTQEDSILAQMITRELERRHLASDALFAERKPMVGQLILKAIDPSRSLLTQEDIRQADIDRLPDQIERGRLNTVYQLYGLSLTRSEERLDYWLGILNQGVGSIDLSDQEELRIRDEETPWVSDLASLKDLWRKQLENQAIGLLLADRTEDETYKALIRRYNSQKIESNRPVLTIFLQASLMHMRVPMTHTHPICHRRIVRHSTSTCPSRSKALEPFCNLRMNSRKS